MSRVEGRKVLSFQLLKSFSKVSMVELKIGDLYLLSISDFRWLGVNTSLFPGTLAK